MIKTWLSYFLALLVATIFFLYYKMWVSWFCLLILSLIPFAALALCIIAAFTFDFEPEVPVSVNNNERAAIKVRIIGLASKLSFCRFRTSVKDVMTDSYVIPKKLHYDAGISEIPVDTTHCGTYIYKITDIKIYDMFGFFFVKRACKKEFEIVVKPLPTVPKTRIDLGSLKPDFIRKASSSCSDMYDIRNYNYGDPLKTVYWKMSAKRDKLLVRESQEQVFSHSRLTVDLGADRDKIDSQLSEMMYTSSYCLDHDVIHRIKILQPSHRELSFDVSSRRELDSIVTDILHMRLAKGDRHAG